MTEPILLYMMSEKNAQTANIKTPMTENLPQEVRDSFINAIALKRLGLPEDVANVVYFLCSPDSDYVSGQVINVCGGALT